MKRVAVLADVHGNMPALEAVLAEVQADAIVCGGDLALGPMPVEVLARMREAEALFVRGNCDRLLGDWVQEQLPTEEVDFLAGLPLTLQLDVDGLGRVLVCHATPRDDDELFTKLTPDAELEDILGDIEADVVVCGHTHVQFDRRVGTRRVVNAGSVGMPFEGPPGAFWALLGPDVELRRTEYDTERAADAIDRSGHPSPEQFAKYLREPQSGEAWSEYFESARGT